jgi:hypothetical protein
MARRTVTVRLGAQLEHAERGLWCVRCLLPSVERIPVVATIDENPSVEPVVMGHLLWCHDEHRLVEP